MSKRPELHILWFRRFWASPRVLGLNRGGRPRKPYACYGCGTESRKKTTKKRQVSLLACPWNYNCCPARGSLGKRVYSEILCATLAHKKICTCTCTRYAHAQKSVQFASTSGQCTILPPANHSSNSGHAQPTQTRLPHSNRPKQDRPCRIKFKPNKPKPNKFQMVRCTSFRPTPGRFIAV